MAAALLGKKPDLLQKRDDHRGWTPLHCAASVDFAWAVRQLLHKDKSAAYIKDNKGRTALHIAVISGAKSSVKELLSQCPDCHEAVDETGRNALHIAATSGREKIAKFIIKDRLYRSLLNEEDVDGNTPLHLLAESQQYIPDLIEHARVDKSARNNQNKTALDILPPWGSSITADSIRGKLERRGAVHGAGNVLNEDGSKKKYDEGSIKDLVQTHLIVAALIATVTFAAGFTLPGGYDQNNGNAILKGKLSFRTFVVSDTIAMVLSISAVFMYFLTSLRPDRFPKLCLWAVYLTMFATAAMVLAFMTGIYAVVGHSSGGRLGVVVCAIGSTFVFFYLYPLKLLFSARS